MAFLQTNHETTELMHIDADSLYILYHIPYATSVVDRSQVQQELHLNWPPEEWLHVRVAPEACSGKPHFIRPVISGSSDGWCGNFR